MKFYKLENFIGGWLIGDFEPNIIKTEQLEFAVKKYTAGFRDKKHIHKIAKELTAIISGKFELNDKIINPGEVILLEPGETADFKCLEDGYNAVIKMPSVKNDKYLTD